MLSIRPVIAVLLALAFLLPANTASGQRGGGGRGRAAMQARRIKAIYLHDYREALPKFDSAVKQLEAALGQEPLKLSKLGKEIEKHSGVFLRYLKHVNEDHPKFEPNELQKFSNSELGWETLTSAERLAPILPRVAELENDTVVNLAFWQALYALEGELTRLKWMASRLK